MIGFEHYGGIAVGSLPFDPANVLAVVASVALVAAVAVMVFIALAPHFSPRWAEKFGGAHAGVEGLENDSGAAAAADD